MRRLAELGMQDQLEGGVPQAPSLLSQLGQTWPARLAKSAWEATQLPAQVYLGEVDPLSDEGIGRAFDLAGFAGGLGPASIAKEAGETLASRSLSGYNPPAKPLRPFAADYPAGARTDASGRLTHDIDGRTIDPAARIVGRQRLGADDVAVGPEELASLTEAISGFRPKGASRRALSGNSGQYVAIRNGGDIEKHVFYADDLAPSATSRVVAHELGHAINDVGGTVPDGRHYRRFAKIGPQDAARRIYNDLNTDPGDWRMFNQERSGVPVAKKYRNSPETHGYPKDQALSELIAEALRANLSDPNYIKSVAPETAKALRAAVNDNPRLNKIIHLNTNDIRGIAPIGLADILAQHLNDQEQ